MLDDLCCLKVSHSRGGDRQREPKQISESNYFMCLMLVEKTTFNNNTNIQWTTLGILSGIDQDNSNRCHMCCFINFYFLRHKIGIPHGPVFCHSSSVHVNFATHPTFCVLSLFHFFMGEYKGVISTMW